MQTKRIVPVLLFILFVLCPLAATAQTANEDLIVAAKRGDLAAVRSALAKGADVNARTNYGATALHFAAERGHLEIVKTLIEAGANVHARDTFYRMTPTAMATMNRHKEVAAYLQQKAAEKPEPAPATPAQAAPTTAAPAPSTTTVEKPATTVAKPATTSKASSKPPIPSGAWPAFRGYNASGNGDGQNAPTTWDATKNINIAWKTPIPGLAHASPIIWGNKLFITTSVSSAPEGKFRHGLYGDVTSDKDLSKHSWKIYCLDKKTGKILWERTAYEGVPKIKRHIKSTHASPTPATDGKHVVAFFGSEGLYCYDTSGKLLWKQDLGVLDSGWFFDADYQWGMASSPIIYNGLVIVQCDLQKDSFIAAFDVKTGQQVWKTKRDEIPSWGTPTVFESNGRAMIVTNATKRIRGYDPKTGKELFELSGNSEVTVGTPVVGHDLVFVTGGYPPIRPVYAIKPTATGDITLAADKETNEHIAWSKKRDGTYMPTPIVYGDYLYTCSNNGVLICYDAKTGERKYQQRVAGQSNAFTASPIAADGKLYLTSEDGDIFVVKAGPQYELLATNPIGEVLMATPAISQGMIFVRSINHVYGIADATAQKSQAKK